MELLRCHACDTTDQMTSQHRGGKKGMQIKQDFQPYGAGLEMDNHHQRTEGWLQSLLMQ